jgi:hypothetical protein
MLLAVLVSSAIFAAPVAPAEPFVDGLVARHVAALGGAERLQAIRSRIERGRYREGTFEIATYAAYRRPFYRVIGEPANALTEIHEAYDGSAWEYYPDPGIVVRTVGPAAAASRHGAAFDDPLVDYALHGTAIADGGDVTIDGHASRLLHVTLADGFTEDVYVDRASEMIVAMERTVPMHAFGERLRTHNELSDYRPEGGVLYPHRFREIDTATGRLLTESTVGTIEINPDLPLASFSPPAWERTPLQTMVQRIYDEREEPVAVMATYRDFRAAYPLGAAEADAVDFVGYQCLKMGHAETAVTLLSANVSAFPKSARAHYGLGRALKEQGKNEPAAAEFRAALAIDPAYARARTALDQLR